MRESSENKGAVIHASDVEKDEVEDGINIQWLIAKNQGSKKIHLRRFVMEPGSMMPLHSHNNCEHLQYYLKGKVKVKIDEHEYKVGEGDAVFIPVGAAHSYTNICEEKAVFLCIVPAVDIETEMRD